MPGNKKQKNKKQYRERLSGLKVHSIIGQNVAQTKHAQAVAHREKIRKENDWLNYTSLDKSLD